MSRKLIAYMDGVVVGYFTEVPPTSTSFNYSEDWVWRYAKGLVQQISLSLPVIPHDQSQDATAFVAGLLPDSMRHRNLLAGEMGIEDDPSEFAFLSKMGRDAAGALTVIPEEEVLSTGKPGVRWIDEAEFAEHLRSLPRRPLLFDEEEGMTLSLAGVNDKTAVTVAKGRIGLPHNGFPSTHVVKVDIPNLKDSIRTEQFCLDIARGIGLNVPNSQIETFGDQTFMIMARYDRVIRGGELCRVHQEDFCQALGVMPSKKYERHGGPGWPEAFELIRQSSDPMNDRRSLLKHAIFQYLSGNPDAHAKNYSLVYKGGTGGVRLSPIYDLNNAEAHRHNFKKTQPIMAMSIGGVSNPNDVDGRAWRQFSADCGFRPDLVLREVYDMAGGILDVLPGARGKQPECEAIDVAYEDIRQRCLKWVSYDLGMDPETSPEP
jgi:serine/threonine-protein kinase HipA